MKTIFKLLIIFTLCFAVLCERNLGFQVDSIGVAIQDNLAPFLKISYGGSFYLMNLQSIYEIYLDPNTNQWTKDSNSEINLNTLSWNITTDLLKGYAALLGAPCPCQTSEQPSNVEPFPVTRRVGRQVRDDPFENLICTPASFGYLRFVFQNVPGMNNSACAPADIATCTSGCNQACTNASNPTNCNNGCAAITTGSIIDTNVCYTTCNISGVVDTDCINGCMNMVDCITQYSCKLNFGYHLHNYQWINSTTNPTAPRKLAFAFEIVSQSSVNVSCGSEVVTWFKGPFLLWINTTTLAMQHQDGCPDCIPDISTAVMVASNFFFAPANSSVIGRVYVDQFDKGLSIFNAPVEGVAASAPSQ